MSALIRTVVICLSILLAGCANSPVSEAPPVPAIVTPPCLTQDEIPTPPTPVARAPGPTTTDKQLVAGLGADVIRQDAYIRTADRLLRRCAAPKE